MKAKYKKEDHLLVDSAFKKYIKECIELHRTPNITGLLLSANLVESDISNWKRNKDFKPHYRIYQFYKQRIKEFYLYKSAETPAGQIFYLKSAFKMKEKINDEISIKIDIKKDSKRTLAKLIEESNGK